MSITNAHIRALSISVSFCGQIFADLCLLLVLFISMAIYNTWGGYVLPYLGMVERFRGDDRLLEIFNTIGSLFYASSWSHSNPNPLFLQKTNGLSLSHLVPEIFGPTIGLILNQNVLFNCFYINFLFDYWSNWSPFSLIFDLFDPSFLQNLRSDWV